MTKKKKTIIAVSSLLCVLLLVCGITAIYLIKVEQNKLKCVDSATEQQIRYILNKPTGDISIELFVDQVWFVTKAFGEARTTRPNEEGLYTLSDGSNDLLDPPTEEYMDEKFLEFSLWLYTHQTGENLAIEEIEKCVTEGNIEKKEEIAAYYDWYYGGGGDYIDGYTREYDGDWDALTLDEQGAAVIEMEND